MNLFLGSNTHKLDSKGRLFVPKRILGGIHNEGEREQFVLTLGLDPSLYLFTRKGFMAYMRNLEQTAFEDPDTAPDAPDRWSIEVRCAVVYD